MATESGGVAEPKGPKAAAVWTRVFSDLPRRLTRWITHFFGPKGQIRGAIAISIALVSALGALAAWRATLTSDEAASMDSTYIQQVTQRGQEVARQEAIVDEEIRLFALYRQHVEAAGRLSEEASQVRQSDPNLANALDAQAQAELDVAHTLQGYFRAAGMSPTETTYDRQFVLDYQLSHDDKLSALHPDSYLAMGKTLHVRAVVLVGLVTIFVAALFFLTLAQLTRPQLRLLFVGAGASVTIAALIVWPMVENGTFDRVFAL